MTAERLTKQFEDETLEVLVQYSNDDKPPESLRTAVHETLKETILGCYVDKTIQWNQVNDDTWELTFVDGMPEKPVILDGTVSHLPPYRTAEEFEGVDKEDGLLQNLPDTWSFENERLGVYTFYQS